MDLLMMRGFRILLTAGAVAAATAGAAVPIACFSLREPPCAFTCVTPSHRCPANYACGSDGLCHREGATGICPFAPPDDAGADAGGDASPPGAADAPDADQ